MLLPASDLGLITSHLPAHDSMVMKVKLLAKEARDEKLIELLNKRRYKITNEGQYCH